MHRSACLAFVTVAACLPLAACGGRDSPAPVFAPADYGYLPKLRLLVGTITVEDHAATASGPGDLAPTAPLPPDQALQQMAHDRLVAAGNSGAGVFTIDQASIDSGGGGALDGHLAVHLDITTGNGGHAGYAEAHVSRRFVPGADTSDAGSRAQLYQLTQQMMQDMNVELEFQMRRSLRDWLVDASGAPVTAGVDQQALPPPDGSAPVATVPSGGVPVGTTPVGATPLGSGALGANGPLPLAPPPGAPAAAPGDAPAPPVRSPSPGFLQPPADAAPVPPPAGTGY